jgi:hypothetical protein
MPVVVDMVDIVGVIVAEVVVGAVVAITKAIIT